MQSLQEAVQDNTRSSEPLPRRSRAPPEGQMIVDGTCFRRRKVDKALSLEDYAKGRADAKEALQQMKDHRPGITSGTFHPREKKYISFETWSRERAKAGYPSSAVTLR